MRIKRVLAVVLAVMIMMSYAITTSLATEIVDGVRPVGDVNGDYVINNTDIVILARCVVGLTELDEEAIAFADMNGDRVISNSDVITLARRVVIKPQPVDTVVFYSLEEFNDAILNAKGGEDIANLAGLDSYRLPTNLPENYKLYKITAGVVDVGFWYMPEECLTSVNSAEANGRHFMFVYGRDAAGSELAEGTFIVEKGVRDVIKWNGGGHALHLYVPTDYTGDNYKELIQTEVVIVKQ